MTRDCRDGKTPLDTLGKLATRSNELFNRVKQGSVDPEIAIHTLQKIIESNDGFIKVNHESLYNTDNGPQIKWQSSLLKKTSIFRISDIHFVSYKQGLNEKSISLKLDAATAITLVENYKSNSTHFEWLNSIIYYQNSVILFEGTTFINSKNEEINIGICCDLEAQLNGQIKPILTYFPIKRIFESYSAVIAR